MITKPFVRALGSLITVLLLVPTALAQPEPDPEPVPPLAEPEPPPAEPPPGEVAPPPRPPPVTCHGALESPWLDKVATAVGSDAALETGAAGNLLVSELTAAVCSAGVEAWLPAACGKFSGGLVELRRRLALDVARWPAEVLRRTERTLPEPQRIALGISVAIIDALLEAPSAGGLAERLKSAPRATAGMIERPCVTGAARDAAHPLAIAGNVIELLSAAHASPQARDEALERLLRERGKLAPGATLDATRRSAVDGLTTALANIDAALVDPSRATELTRSFAHVASASLVVASGSAAPIDTRAATLVQALEQGPRAGVGAGLATLNELAPQLKPPRLPTIVEVVAAIAEAPDEDRARRALVRLVVPLSPWMDDVLFDINLGTVKLDDRDFQFSGDLLIGYVGRSFGLSARGALYEYDLTTDERVVQISQREGWVDGWYTLGERGLRFELRGEGRGAYVDTTRISVAAGDTPFADETSILLRGMLLGSVRYEAARGAAGLWLGGGVQYEEYTPLTLQRSGVISLGDEVATTAIFQARFRAQVTAIPQWLGFRARVDGLRYAVRRDRELFQLDTSGTATTGSTAEDATQTEVHARMFIDAEVARFAGFVPTLFGGVDFLGIETSTQGSQSLLAPVFGAGIRRTAF